MRTYNVRFKRKVAREDLSGKGGYKILVAKFDIADSLVRRWIRAYQHHGSAGLIHQRGRCMYEFKLEVLHRLVAETSEYESLHNTYYNF